MPREMASEVGAMCESLIASFSGTGELLAEMGGGYVAGECEFLASADSVSPAGTGSTQSL